MKTLKERTEIQQAYLDGKQIQFSDDGVNWRSPSNLSFDSWNSLDYRVKPKPMERWINIYDRNGDEYIHETKKEAEKARLHKNIKVRTVKFIQAPDDEQ